MREDKLLPLLYAVLVRPLVDKALSLDPKIVATAVTFAATYLVTGVLGLGLDKTVISVGQVDVTWAVVIAFVAAHVAGYYRTNVATILRKPQPDGNVPLKLLEEKLGPDAEVSK